MVSTISVLPPPPILPRTGSKLKILYIDPLEMARQFSIMESEMFFKITSSECIAHSMGATLSTANLEAVLKVNQKVRSMGIFTHCV
jgi:son of sevenless-like protein